MPKILEDRVKAIGRSNPDMPKSNRFAIATAALQKEGKLPRAQDRKAKGGKVKR